MDMLILRVTSQGVTISLAVHAIVPADYIWRRSAHATLIASFMLTHVEAALAHAFAGNGRLLGSTPLSRWMTSDAQAAAAPPLVRRADRDRCRRLCVRLASCALAPDRPETRSGDRYASPAILD